MIPVSTRGRAILASSIGALLHLALSGVIFTLIYESVAIGLLLAACSLLVTVGICFGAWLLAGWISEGDE